MEIADVCLRCLTTNEERLEIADADLDSNEVRLDITDEGLTKLGLKNIREGLEARERVKHEDGGLIQKEEALLNADTCLVNN